MEENDFDEKMKDKSQDNVKHDQLLDAEDFDYKTTEEYQGIARNWQPVERKLPVMDDEKYLKERLDHQIDWFDKRSKQNQAVYKSRKRIEFILASMIPIIISFSTMAIVTETKIIGETFRLSTLFQVVAALAGVVLVVLTKIFELEEYYKNWKNYRITCETLQHEKMMYLTRTEPYDEPNAFPLLVEKVEFILNKEIQKWKQVAVPKQSDLVNKAEASLNKQKFGNQNVKPKKS